jgi:hypothetical protein
LYQPFASGGRAAAAVTLGGVASYFSATVCDAERFPALSTHVAVTDAELESGPESVVDVHDAMPEVASLPLAVT